VFVPGNTFQPTVLSPALCPIATNYSLLTQIHF